MVPPEVICDSVVPRPRGNPRAGVLLLLFLVIVFVDPVTAQSSRDIKVEVNIPTEVDLDKTANLDCTWRLQGNGSLYTVKWTKDEYEIFSYNPENPPRSRIKLFPRDGFNVELYESEMRVDTKAQTQKKISIKLTQMTHNSSGMYKCEVSTGAPFFHTNFRRGSILVISPPQQGPDIIGLSDNYALGENLTANCTSWPSIPKAKLHWVINNKTVQPEYVVDYPPKKLSYSQGIPNSQGLSMTITSRLLQTSNGKLRVRCIAYVASRRYETEKYVNLAHANNQRFSAFDIRSSATYSAFYSITLLFVTAIIVT